MASLGLTATAGRGEEPPSPPAGPRPLADSGPLRLDLPALDLRFSGSWAQGQAKSAGRGAGTLPLEAALELRLGVSAVLMAGGAATGPRSARLSPPG